ncbi:DUF1850 domain-containing protein [Azoarcus olearius]|uniref:Conserved hypothetical secreted protein n=1 Tax=Azoarcus sp. (strain BH72) TaxID=418699 RepID=A1K6S8_AZOSB|nr:DUF1850 domain-containing protein [Azoarcus olearius]CAL94533.1 conserved hypothetical secreted protein [Azoarcus olearius]
MAVCLATAAATAVVAVHSFTLAWTHSIEKQRWEEDWAVRGEGAVAALVLERVRVRGHGAGMEPPAGAHLRDGVWEWQPGTTHAVLRLTRSGFTADYSWCPDRGHCVPLGDILPGDGGVTEVRACSMSAKEEGASTQSP